MKKNLGQECVKRGFYPSREKLEQLPLISLKKSQFHSSLDPLFRPSLPEVWLSHPEKTKQYAKSFNISKTLEDVSNILRNVKFMRATVFEIAGGPAGPIPLVKRVDTKRLGTGMVKRNSRTVILTACYSNVQSYLFTFYVKNHQLFGSLTKNCP